MNRSTKEGIQYKQTHRKEQKPTGKEQPTQTDLPGRIKTHRREQEATEEDTNRLTRKNYNSPEKI